MTVFLMRWDHLGSMFWRPSMASEPAKPPLDAKSDEMSEVEAVSKMEDTNSKDISSTARTTSDEVEAVSKMEDADSKDKSSGVSTV